MGVYYRVIEEDIGPDHDEDENATCFVDVIIQTEDPSDFADFEDAHRECLGRLQERFDRAEGTDPKYAARIQEWITDSGDGAGDWEGYATIKSQPEVPNPTVKFGWFCLTEVAGRRAAREFLDGGGNFGEEFHDQAVAMLEWFERAAAVGAGGPKTKVKIFKDRPRPPLNLWKIRVAPSTLEALGAPLLRGLLREHQRSWSDQGEGWTPLEDGFSSRMWRSGDDLHYHLFTVFLDPGQDMTYVVGLPAAEDRPSDSEMMNLATIDFEMEGEADSWSPDHN